ncbi:hypothetical protein BGX28_002661 [Mortierella sp. GBA30]|nr:hypothetical protein BGX28_002661 [Mortierella sp. GBA30]
MRFTIIISAVFAIAQAAPLITTTGVAIPDSYIVLLKEGNTVDSFKTKIDAVARLQGNLSYNLTITHKYDIFPAFSVTANKAALTLLLNANEVRLVEQDDIATLASVQQDPPSWGLRRISQRKLDLTAGYVYNDTAGEGVAVYILDTGVNRLHTDLQARVLQGKSFVGFGNETADLHGHGTHVAGIVGGKRFGVAKKVHIVPVKVQDDGNCLAKSSTLAALNWVHSNATRGKSVVNMSYFCPHSDLVNGFVKKLFDANIPVIAAAGNHNKNACDYSPASSKVAYIVGHTTQADGINKRSNIGSCVNIFAPGTNITSTRTKFVGLTNLATDDTEEMTGSSMAAPHVAGVCALYLSVWNFTTAQALYDQLTLSATAGNITGDLQDSPNKLLYNGGVSLSRLFP